MAEPRKEWRLNLTPRFTVLQLGEYSVLEDGPRETLLRNMKYERLAPSLIYRKVYAAITAFLVHPLRDSRILIACREDLERTRDSAELPRQRENASYALNALDAFERSANHVRMGNVTFAVAPPATYLRIEDVKVSVQPSALILVARSRGSDLVGALIVDAAKGAELRTEAARERATQAMKNAAILLHQHVVAQHDGMGVKPSCEHAIVFHSHRQQTESAPSSHRRELRNLTACCRSIADRWDRIVPPPKFDIERAYVRR